MTTQDNSSDTAPKRYWPLLALAISTLTTLSALAADQVSQVVGAWRLISYEVIHVDGTRTNAFVKPTGQIIYTPDGRMSVHMLDLDPPRCDPRVRSDCDRQPSAVGYSGYWGRYELSVDGKSVQHFVENFSTHRSDRTAADFILTRTVELEGDRITLTTPPRKRGGEMVVMTLVWERIK